MKQFVIHNEEGYYLPNSKYGNWTKKLRFAKKYSQKPAMFKKLLQIMERYPREEFFFDTGRHL
jgi:hypothetical protein